MIRLRQRIKTHGMGKLWPLLMGLVGIMLAYVFYIAHTDAPFVVARRIRAGLPAFSKTSGFLMRYTMRCLYVVLLA